MRRESTVSNGQCLGSGSGYPVQMRRRPLASRTSFKERRTDISLRRTTVYGACISKARGLRSRRTLLWEVAVSGASLPRQLRQTSRLSFPFWSCGTTHLPMGCNALDISLHILYYSPSNDYPTDSALTGQPAQSVFDGVHDTFRFSSAFLTSLTPRVRIKSSPSIKTRETELEGSSS